METKYYSWEKIINRHLNSICFGIINILFIVLFAASGVHAQSTQIGWSNFSGGFGISASETILVTSSAGFSFTGETKNGSSDILSGFLVDYSMIITGIEDYRTIIPSVYSLSQNYPNPFNPSTIINYRIPEEGFVTLKVYNILGKEVKTLVNENKTAGSYNIYFDGSGLASGVYIYRFKAANYSSTRKMLLIK
ncbi:MAG TPA: T9SS type A sorting domain-containing protein [Ignavibacteriaceae bacterium]|nr:T9SS type A sorting domain-containing protein [Ignavibacteriaceae bacterium]